MGISILKAYELVLGLLCELPLCDADGETVIMLAFHSMRASGRGSTPLRRIDTSLYVTFYPNVPTCKFKSQVTGSHW